MSIEEQYNRAKDNLNGRLFAPYQREGVLWMLTMEGQKSGPKGGFLCDEMGLGKSIQLIATMLGNPKPRTLIIVPKSIITQWAEEINRFAPNLTINVFDGPERKMKEADVTLAPYTLLTTKGAGADAKTPLHMVQWDRVILDEAHEIRNKKSKLFKSVCRIQTQIKWIVTGTPVFNSIEDFVSLCTFLGLSKVVVQGMTNKIKDIYILRRTKEDLSQISERLRLPPCYFENVELEMYPDEKQLYELMFLEAQETIRDAFRDAQSLNAKNMVILECLLRARQCMIHPPLYLDGVAKKTGTQAEKWVGRSNKMETLFEMVKSHPSEKTLIFCQFRGEMNHIQKNMERPVFRIDGSVHKEERVGQIEGFKKAAPGAVFIIQIKAGGQGLNLQEATRVYITAPSWNPATELQAIGRSHRTGQTKPVYVKKLIYKECARFVSVEEEMMALQGHKSIVCSKVLNDERIERQIPVNRTSAKISILDIKKIFKA
jgi:SNF2 family DNA or RNA helicase|tara:strand:+ start:5424 stop:6881 length:1458 start_codon:yes stop_codon:yes gene_type:complete